MMWPATVDHIAERLHVALSNGEGVVSDRTHEGAQMVCDLIWGYLRGNVPDPLPADLETVAVIAGLRITKGFSQTGTMFLHSGEYNSIADFRPWMGFMLAEKIVLDRYRKTVA